ncbi:ATP-binding protein [Streptomyces sp. NPDC001852]|uniref:ATP-binding protein n=1 Tax=Streptomyces sp. NPDC001852 TaxID=3364619 RepID=UPI0036B7E970
MECSACTSRRPWELPFLAVPEEVVALRRVLKIHLRLWGLPELIDSVQLCLSELVSNVIRHVGPGTPSTLVVSMYGTRLHIEIHDPDSRALPTLIDANGDAESGRGMALVAACSDRWGVQLLPDRKVTWVEFETTSSTPNGHSQNLHVSRAASVLSLYNMRQPAHPAASSRLSATTAERVVVAAIADLLHWLQAHGHDVDQALDRAQLQFEAEAEQLAKR